MKTDLLRVAEKDDGLVDIGLGKIRAVARRKNTFRTGGYFPDERPEDENGQPYTPNKRARWPVAAGALLIGNFLV